MAVNLMLLAERLKTYRNQFGLSIFEVAHRTGIDEPRLTAFESGIIEPSGDELLIIADLYLVNDYRVFLSAENHQAPFEQIKTLFRKFGDDLTVNDRWAIQEVLFLAECEAFLEGELNKPKRVFSFRKLGGNYKLQGESAAIKLREHLGYQEVHETKDVFQDIRNLGIHIFRRKLESSTISGVFIKHPGAGKVILINYSEDIYRQRFTATHELGHSILDLVEDDVDVTKVGSNRDRLVEIRGNTFASHFLLPSSVLKRIPNIQSWNEDKIKEYSKHYLVNPEMFAYALARENYIDQNQVNQLKKVKLIISDKEETEFYNVSSNGRLRRKAMLERGISEYFVRLCFDASRHQLISHARMAEMLLVDLSDLKIIYEMFGESYYVES